MKKKPKLEKLRKNVGLTYQDMASKLRISKSQYWQLEHNNRRLSYEMAKKIAHIFHLKPDDIFYEDID